jgi:hypothetical protein
MSSRARLAPAVAAAILIVARTRRPRHGGMDAAFDEVFVRNHTDPSGDPIGDLRGRRARLRDRS